MSAIGQSEVGVAQNGGRGSGLGFDVQVFRTYLESLLLPGQSLVGRNYRSRTSCWSSSERG